MASLVRTDVNLPGWEELELLDQGLKAHWIFHANIPVPRVDMGGQVHAFTSTSHHIDHASPREGFIVLAGALVFGLTVAGFSQREHGARFCLFTIGGGCNAGQAHTSVETVRWPRYDYTGVGSTWYE